MTRLRYALGVVLTAIGLVLASSGVVTLVTDGPAGEPLAAVPIPDTSPAPTAAPAVPDEPADAPAEPADAPTEPVADPTAPEGPTTSVARAMIVRQPIPPTPSPTPAAAPPPAPTPEPAPPAPSPAPPAAPTPRPTPTPSPTGDQPEPPRDDDGPDDADDDEHAGRACRRPGPRGTHGNSHAHAAEASAHTRELRGEAHPSERGDRGARHCAR